MASDLQVLVDHLAEHVGASTVLEDRGQRTIAHSSQRGPIDETRRDSILHRVTPPETIAWFRSFGIDRGHRPIAIPANEALGILPRLCAPVRCRGQLLGFLWVIDNDGSIAEHHLDVLEKAAEHAGVLLYEEQLAQRLTSQAISHLLSPSEELRGAAAQQIAEQSLLPDDQPLVCVVVQPLEADGAEADVPHSIEEALSDAGWEAPSSSFLRRACGDHGVLLVRLRTCEDDSAAFGLALAARAALEHRLCGPSGRRPRVVAALGDPQGRLEQAFASYRQARLAVKVAAAFPAISDVVRWSKLGVFRALAQLSTKEAQESALDPRVLSLLEAGDETVVATLETYLDLAGDVKATAEALHMHRGTLYYRLEKAERIAGIDFRNGYDRLAVHLGLKLARLAGRREAPTPAR